MKTGNPAARWKARNRGFWRRATESASKEDPRDLGTRAGEIIDFGDFGSLGLQRKAWLWFHDATRRRTAAAGTTP